MSKANVDTFRYFILTKPSRLPIVPLALFAISPPAQSAPLWGCYMLLPCFICGTLTGICMASARVPVDGAALLVVAGAGFLVANEDDETASKPWTLEAYVAAIHKLAVDMHDDTFIKATVSVQAVLDDDPRTLSPSAPRHDIRRPRAICRGARANRVWQDPHSPICCTLVSVTLLHIFYFECFKYTGTPHN